MQPTSYSESLKAAVCPAAFSGRAWRELRRACRMHLALSVGLLAAAGAMPAACAADDPPEPLEAIELFEAGQQTGTLILPPGAADRRTPVVVILPDMLGQDARSGAYVDQLLGAGFAVLDLVWSDEWELASVLDALAAHPRILPDSISLMGFGSGARTVARWTGRVDARVLLYPGCAGVAPAAMRGERVLLMHGDADQANPAHACAALGARIASEASELHLRAYPGATYAWDRPAFPAERVNLLPTPDGAGRVPSVAWPELAALSAAEVAGFFATRISRIIP